MICGEKPILTCRHSLFRDDKGMTVTIYGLLGHAGKLALPLESLDIEELAAGEEFVFNGRVYEIRSVMNDEETVLVNVSLVMNHASA
jgi:hypothetical protein